MSYLFMNFYDIKQNTGTLKAPQIIAMVLYYLYKRLILKSTHYKFNILLVGSLYQKNSVIYTVVLR